jgi:hypothetical protein
MPSAAHCWRLMALFKISTDMMAVDKIFSWYLVKNRRKYGGEQNAIV